MAKKQATGANIGFEEKLWLAADKLRGSMDASEYKHIILGLIFLKYISDKFCERRDWLIQETVDPKSQYHTKNDKDRNVVLEDRDEYTAGNIFWVPASARWDIIQKDAKKPTIGQVIDNAMDLIERENRSLKGILPKNYAKPEVDKRRLGELIDLISTIDMLNHNEEQDLLGRIYEYFLGKFAAAEGKGGGEFYTPSCVVRTLVEMLQPYKGRIYDPCCGSGGMFVQSEKFVEAHGGQKTDLSVFGQESNPTTWRLARMNMALRGIECDLGDQWADTFHHDKHPDMKADFILANPPFNISDWGGEKLKDDKRWVYGIPPAGNANFAWVQHIVHHLSPKGRAGFVLANISLTSGTGGEDLIRKKLIEKNLVECIVTLPDKLFYATPISVCLWILNRARSTNSDEGERNKEILFIDASSLGEKVNRTHCNLRDVDVSKISSTYREWASTEQSYRDVDGFCRSVPLSDVVKNNFTILPASYINAGRQKNDGRIQIENVVSGPACLQVETYLEQVNAFASKFNIHLSEVRKSLGFLESNVRFKKYALDDVLERSDERLGDADEPEILTCTESGGLILQRERFAKRVATDDASNYKIVQMGDIVYNPYLLWKGSIDQCWIVEKGITSPAYEILRVRQGFDPTIIGQIVTSPEMVKRYDGISFGTVQRRRRAPVERFLELEINVPNHEHIAILSQLLKTAQESQLASRNAERSIKEFIKTLTGNLR